MQEPCAPQSEPTRPFAGVLAIPASDGCLERGVSSNRGESVGDGARPAGADTVYFVEFAD